MKSVRVAALCLGGLGAACLWYRRDIVASYLARNYTVSREIWQSGDEMKSELGSLPTVNADWETKPEKAVKPVENVPRSRTRLPGNLVFELSERVRLRMGSCNDTQANRLAAHREALDVMRRLIEVEKVPQWVSVRVAHKSTLVLHAVNLVFLPTDDEIMAARAARSAYWRYRVRQRDGLFPTVPDFLARLFV
jgi:hypothetical protein